MSIALAVLFLASSSEAFTVLPPSNHHHHHHHYHSNGASTATASVTTGTSTTLNFFGDAMKNAFGNDDSLGKDKNAGLTNGPQENDKVSLNGKKIKAVVGQKVSVIAAQNRVKISYNCKAGDCGTCIVNMNGRKVKACQMTIPPGKCNINTI